MSRDLLILPESWLRQAAQAKGIPAQSKGQMAAALAAAGVTAAMVRVNAGAAPVVDMSTIDATAKAATDATTQAAQALAIGQQAAQVAAQAQQATQAVQSLAQKAESAALAAAQAAAAAGAVAARAEAAALASKPVAADPDAIRAAIAEVVGRHLKPLEEVLAQASPEVLAEVAAVVAGPVERRSVLDVFGVDLRDRKGNPITVECWADPTAPAVDPVYIWSESLLRHFVAAQHTGENLWLAGPKGTGKTQAAQQWAARTGRAFTRINFQKFTCPEDYIGSVGLEGGATAFKAGDFLLAYRRPGAVILLDEISNADPGNLAVLNGYLEPGARVNAGGSLWSRANGVMVLAADNSQGNGDDSGRYAGLRQMNSSLVDRFARMVVMDYLPAREEVKALVAHTGCSRPLAAHVIKFIGAARAKVATGDIIDAPSLRQAIAFVRALEWMGVDEAWASTIASKQPAESAAALEAVRSTCLNVQTIQEEM